MNANHQVFRCRDDNLAVVVCTDCPDREYPWLGYVLEMPETQMDTATGKLRVTSCYRIRPETWTSTGQHHATIPGPYDLTQRLPGTIFDHLPQILLRMMEEDKTSPPKSSKN